MLIVERGARSDEVMMCSAANTSLDELDLSWNCFRSRSAVSLIKGLEVIDTCMQFYSL